MEYEKQEQLPPYEKASDFLSDCNNKIKSLIKESRQCLRSSDTISYQQALIDKGLFITDMPEMAECVIKAGLDLPSSVIDLLDALSEEAWDAIEYASITKDYHLLANMLIRTPRDHHHIGNRLEELIHDLKQNE